MKPEDKRQHLKQRLSKPQTFAIPGAFNAICAKFVQKHGFECTYVSGSGTAGGVFGLPDLGLTTLTEAATEAGYVARSVTIPTIADADTGFGELINVPRTVEEFERQGLSGLHLEDQVFPKRCGHLEGKEIIPESVMVAKVRAAVSARSDPNFLIIARVDAYSVTGFEDMLHRAKAYEEAGADIIFPEALASLSEFEKVANALNVPVLANMTEFGKTPYYSIKQFEDVGVRCVLFPLTVFRAAMHTMDMTLKNLQLEGTQEPLLDTLYSRENYYDLIEYHSYEEPFNAAP